MTTYQIAELIAFKTHFYLKQFKFFKTSEKLTSIIFLISQ